MAVYSIISIVRKKGSYEGKDYDNVLVYGENVDGGKYVKPLCGSEVEMMKSKYEAFAVTLGRCINTLNSDKIKGVADLLGVYIQPIYNKYGQMEDFNLMLPPDHAPVKK